MDGVDPDTLLEWLQTGAGEERDLQLMALEQLCMLLLMSDNIDRCFESCPPRSFLPALGRIFIDETAPENILEVTARAITYYLDVSNECTRRITQVEGAIKAICNRLVAAEMTDRTSKDLAEQCVKLLEHICQREAAAVYEAGGLQCMLHLVRQNDQQLHKDTMHSAMNVITRLCSKVDPQDESLPKCGSDLGALLSHDDATISECALRCFAALTDRFIRKSLDPAELAAPSGLVGRLLDALAAPAAGAPPTEGAVAARLPRSPAFISVVLSLISNLCRGSATVTSEVTNSAKLIPALRSVLNSRDERCVMDSLRLADLLIVLLCEGRGLLPRAAAAATSSAACSNAASGADRTHRHLVDTIRQHDTDALIDTIESGTVDSNFVDDVGQTLLNWCSAFGTAEMVAYLCNKGADPNKGQRSSSLHYAACFGRPEVVIILLRHGANPELHDEEGRTALERARERSDEGHEQVVRILESPGTYTADEKPTSGAGPAAIPAGDASSSVGASDAGRDQRERSPPADRTLIKAILQQLIPIFCNIYRNSLLGSVRRSTLLLIRKCIGHLSSEDIAEMVDGGTPAEPDFVASFMGVLGAAFGYDDDADGKEQALLIMKNLLEKDQAFWLEQLIRLGIYEKVEALAANYSADTPPAAPSMPFSAAEDSVGGASVGIDSSPIPFDVKSDANLDRSVSATPSVGSLSLRTDAESRASGGISHHSFSEQQAERAQMLNIPVESEGVEPTDHRDGSSGGGDQSVSPTIEGDLPLRRRTASSSSATATAVYPRIQSQFASVRADLVEAATAVAQVLGVQIVDTDDDNDDTDERIQSQNQREQSGLGNLAIDLEAQAPSRLASGVHYKWNSWRLLRYNDIFYVWCDAVVLEFSEGSNGWLRYMMDGRLNRISSDGKVEPCADEANGRAELIGRIRRAKSSVPTGAMPRALFARPTARVEAGNWRLVSIPAGGDETVAAGVGFQLVLANVENAPQSRRIVIRADQPGFVYADGRDVVRTFSAESTLGVDFMTGWTTRNGSRHLQNRAIAQRKKLGELAKELWENYLREAKTKPRDALVALQSDAQAICALVAAIRDGDDGATDSDEFDADNVAKIQLSDTLERVRRALADDRLLSTFELSVSNIVPALLLFLETALEGKCRPLAKCFLMVFSDANDLRQLVRRVVLVLEHVEKFPQPLYDTPGGSPFGLQLLTRRFHLRMEQGDASDAVAQRRLMDRTDRTMKAEPLATVGALRQYVYSMVARSWYDFPRAELAFVQEIRRRKAVGDELDFVYQSDFDTNGLIWYLGTNGRTAEDWTNPAVAKVVNVYCSDESNQPHGQPSDVLSRDITALNCHTTDSSDANFTIDLGVWLYPTKYTLRHAYDRTRTAALRSWFLQGSRDAFVWDVLAAHSNDESLNASGDTATWPIGDDDEDADGADDSTVSVKRTSRRGPYRYFRVAQNGYNASGTSRVLSLSGFEIYGTVVDVVDSELKPLESQRHTASTKSSTSSSGGGISALSSLIASKKQRTSSKSDTPPKPDSAAKSTTFTSTARAFSTLTSLGHATRPPAASSAAAIRHSITARKQQRQKIVTPSAAPAENYVSNAPTLRQKISYSAGTTPKLRMFRTHRNRPAGIVSSAAGSFPASADLTTPDSDTTTPTGSLLRIGARVVPGPDSTICQDTAIVGTVVGVEKSGWVDVQWDDGSLSAYRFGLDGKYEVDLQNDANSKPFALPRIVTSHQSKPVTHTTASDVLKSAKHFTPATGIDGHVTNLSAIEDVEDQAQQQQQNAPMDGLVTGVSTTINQKSMSATNLFDEKPPRYSVASSKQAASAESLQHQTPSLENLLARSRLQPDRILEVVGDELPSPTSSDTRPFGSQEACNHQNESAQESSIAANTFAGGSQPVLSTTRATTATTQATSVTRRIDSSAEQLDISSSSVNTMISEEAERDNVADLPSAFFKRDSTASNDRCPVGRKTHHSKSVSEPNLLESSKNDAFRKIRQKSLAPSLADFAESEQPESKTTQKGNDAESSEKSLKFHDPTGGDLATGSSLMDPDYVNRFLNSSEFYERLNATISDETTPARRINDKASDSDEMGESFLDSYVEDAILREFMIANRVEEPPHEHNSGNSSALPTASIDDFGVVSHQNSSSATSSNALANRGQQQLASLGNGLKAKLGTYADVLRGVMQQVVESSSGMIGADFNGDAMADEIFDDDFIDAQNLIENNCDDDASGDFVSRNFYAEVESLASATAAIRQHLASRTSNIGHIDQDSSPSTSSSFGALMAAVTGANRWGTAYVDAPGVSGSSLTAAARDTTKLNWRQLFLGASLGDDSSMSTAANAGNVVDAGGAIGIIGDTRSSAASRAAAAAQRRAQRVWDDDYVLRRQFGALIPAFDPRPGRTNINQTQEVELSNDADARYVRRGSIVKQFFHHSPFKAEAEAARHLRLYLRGPNLPNIENTLIELVDGDSTLFRYVQQLCASVDWRGDVAMMLESIDRRSKSAPLPSPGEQSQGNRRIWEPTYTLVYEYRQNSNDESSGGPQPSDSFSDLVKTSLRLTRLLKVADKQLGGRLPLLPEDAFHSSKLTQKLRQCLTDPMLVAAGALPTWCARLVYEYPCLFSTETRILHLKATAFGTSRAIAWLQNRRDQIIEQNRASLSPGASAVGYRREDHYPEYRIGRIKHERIKVHRNEEALLENATRVMNFHAMRKSVLEIEYYDEEGTGLGPTLEFYALVAAEFQRKSLAMWLCDDSDEQEIQLEAEQLDLGEGMKPPGYYVRRSSGLFPAYCPPNSEQSAAVSTLFRTLGTFLAKVLLDGRLVDIPMSPVFLDLLLSPSVAIEDVPNLSNVLGLNDLANIQPLKAKFLRWLQEFVAQRDAILASTHLSELEKQHAIEALRVGDGDAACRLEDLALTFALNPPSRVFTWREAELVENGASIDVTAANVHDYVAKCLDFYLNEGIREQALLFGEQCPQWTREDLLRYTEPKLGYTRDSPVYLRFIDVLAEMNGTERKAFLQFATGCASLPPGGLANLHPHLTVVRKVDADTPAGSGGDGAYPSVNTCVHYLKLPEYSSAAILRERLLAATHEKGFHLN